MTQKYEKIKAYLQKDLPVRLDLRDEVSSTNTLLKQIGAAGEPEGYIMVARQQNMGRGRLGRSFLSPVSGIYMSVLLRPKMPVTEAVRITCTAGVAVAEAIREVTGLDARVKWVNDVYIGDRKVCGILTESVLDENGGIAFAVLGIGINLCMPKDGFDASIAGTAGALYNEEIAPDGVRERLIAEVWNRFFSMYQSLNDSDIANRYRALSMMPGRRIVVLSDYLSGCGREATALSIDDNFGLTVRYDDGTTETLATGDVSLRFLN